MVLKVVALLIAAIWAPMMIWVDPVASAPLGVMLGATLWGHMMVQDHKKAIALRAAAARAQMYLEEEQERQRVQRIRYNLHTTRDRHRTPADLRAEELFISHLTESQRLEWESGRYITVLGSDRKTYQLTPASASNVYCVQDGRAFCGYPMGQDEWGSRTPLPLGDRLLGQKLLLENDAEHFRSVAY